MTLGKWRQQLRLMHAMRLLGEGAKVTYVALEAGYSTPSAFIAAFRKTLGTTPARVSEHAALKDMRLPNTGGINLHATLLVTKTLLIAGEGWGGAHVIRAYDKGTGAVLSELAIPGMMGSMPMTYVANGKQYVAFTVGTATEPAEVIALALPN